MRLDGRERTRNKPVNAFHKEHGRRGGSSSRTLFFGKPQKAFAIEPEKLGKIAGLERDLPIEERIDRMISELKKEFPESHFVRQPKWFATSINGQPLQYANLYATEKEFVTIVHIPFKCPTFTGRFKGMEVYSAVVQGGMTACREGDLRPKKYGVGEVYHLKGGEVKNIEFSEDTIILDYYRCNILTVVPYSVLLPTLFQTGDFIGFWEQLKDSFSLVMKNIKEKKDPKSSS